VTANAINCLAGMKQKTSAQLIVWSMVAELI
jgi:hypothetical protein